MLDMALNATYTFSMAQSAKLGKRGNHMKTLLLSFVLASAAIAAASDTPSLSGKWQLHNNISGNESDQACTFTHTGSELTGSCSSDQGTVNITGKVEDKKVNWIYKSEYNGSPITLTYKGTLDSTNKISGSVRVEEYDAEGEFTATPSK